MRVNPRRLNAKTMERGENQGSRLYLHDGLSNDYLNRFAEAVMVIELLDEDLIAEMTPWCPRSYREHFSASHFTDAPIVLEAHAALPQAQREQLEMLASRIERMLVATFAAFAHFPQERWIEISRRASPLLRREFAVLARFINGMRHDDEPAPPLEEALNLILAD